MTTQVAANDIDAAIDYICRLKGVNKVHLLGWSWGASTGRLFATHHPEKVDRLVLYGLQVTLRPTDVAPTTDFRINAEENLMQIFDDSEI